MTWTKLSDDFADECGDLSDHAFRCHVEGLIWALRRETGGYLSDRDVRRCMESERAEDGVAELVARGMWAREGDGYRIGHHMEHEPEPEVLVKRRAATAERVRRHRLKAAGGPRQR